MTAPKSIPREPGKLHGALPWTRSCFVCGQDNPHGLHLRSRIENGRVMLDYTPREADLGYKHIVHGGIAITLLDEVMTWASIVAARRICVAAELATRLKKPIHVGQTLRVEGWVVRQTITPDFDRRTHPRFGRPDAPDRRRQIHADAEGSDRVDGKGFCHQSEVDFTQRNRGIVTGPRPFSVGLHRQSEIPSGIISRGTAVGGPAWRGLSSCPPTHPF